MSRVSKHTTAICSSESVNVTSWGHLVLSSCCSNMYIYMHLYILPQLHVKAPVGTCLLKENISSLNTSIPSVSDFYCIFLATATVSHFPACLSSAPGKCAWPEHVDFILEGSPRDVLCSFFSKFLSPGTKELSAFTCTTFKRNSSNVT